MNSPSLVRVMLRPAQSRSAASRQRHGTPRRISIAITLTISVGMLLLAPITVSAVGRTAASPAGPASTAVAPCKRTVKGFTAAAVNAARNAAGVGGIVCFPAGTYTGDLTMSVARQLWRLHDNAKLTGIVTMTAPGVTLYNGQITRSTSDRWLASVQIRADNATVESVAFRGGGTGIGVYGKDRTRIMGNSFLSLSGSAISIWSEGVGADYTYISYNRIIQTRTFKVSPITSRGNESTDHGGVQNVRTIIRKNIINQGSGDVGWFGIELKQSRAPIVESNAMTGGHVLVSLPETDDAVVRNNAFDLRGSAHWAIEVGNAWDTIVEGNTFTGDGPRGVDYAVSQNSNPLRTIVRTNKARNLRTLVGIAGVGHRVQNNCLTGVANVTEFMLNGQDVVVSGNKAC